MRDPKRVVQEGYDRIADRFAEWAGGIVDPGREEWVARLDTLLPAGARVLELGCGGDNPSTRRLSQRYRLTGVDISEEQIRRARGAFPHADFMHGDFTALELPDRSFEAVVSVHVFNHVPREELPPLYERVARWLRPAGYLLVSTPTNDNPEWYEEDWLGAPTFFNGWDAETNLRLVREAGFAVLDSDEPELIEPEPDAGTSRFLWILAQAAS